MIQEWQERALGSPGTGCGSNAAEAFFRCPSESLTSLSGNAHHQLNWPAEGRPWVGSGCLDQAGGHRPGTLIVNDRAAVLFDRNPGVRLGVPDRDRTHEQLSSEPRWHWKVTSSRKLPLAGVALDIVILDIAETAGAVLGRRLNGSVRLQRVGFGHPGLSILSSRRRCAGNGRWHLYA